MNVVGRDQSSGSLPPNMGSVLQSSSVTASGVTSPGGTMADQHGSQTSSSSPVLATSNKTTEPAPTPMSEDAREFVCGWGAAFINITVTFPMNKLMFRQVWYSVCYGNDLHLLFW